MNELHRFGTPPRGRVDQIKPLRDTLDNREEAPRHREWAVYVVAVGLEIKG